MTMKVEERKKLKERGRGGLNERNLYIRVEMKGEMSGSGDRGNKEKLWTWKWRDERN